MKNNNILIAIILCLTGTTLFAQNVDEIMKKYMDVTRTEAAVQSNINYALYKNEDGTKAYESYDGVQIRKQEVFYQQLQKMEYIQGKDFVVKLNADQKLMMVGYASQPILQGVDQIASDKLLEYFNEKNIEDKTSYWEVTLSSQEPELSDISRIILHINKESFKLSKQILFFDTISDFAVYEEKAEPDMGIPRLEITYTNYNNTITNPKVLEKERYFIYKDDNITAAPEFKDFEVILAN